ncbi:MAG: hypothetical protein IIY78_05635 [Clostridia bacterium]|nr:hypothetical protein [Clostridia bacterium]
MAYIDENSAYDLSLFEEREESAEKKPRSQENIVYDLNKERRQRRWANVNVAEMLAVTAITVMVIISVSAIIKGQAQLTELNHQITSAQSTLDELASTYTQVQMSVENKLGPSVVEEYAKNVLGMSKTDSSQKEFISFSQGDKAVVAEDVNKGLLEKLKDALVEAWSDK